jgi:hypothetical protein
MNAHIYLWYLAEFFLEWEKFRTQVVGKIKIHILCPKTFFSPENLAVSEVMWTNMVLPDRPRMGWVVSATAWPRYPGKYLYPKRRRLGVSQGRSGPVRKIAPPPAVDVRTVQPIASRYTDSAIPAHK